MQRADLETEEQLREIVQKSEARPYLIFKHSTRCSVSAAVLNRLERAWENDKTLPIFCYLDILARRPLSDEIARLFGAEHESPQALLIHRGICTYHASHMNINYPDIRRAAQQAADSSDERQL